MLFSYNFSFSRGVDVLLVIVLCSRIVDFALILALVFSEDVNSLLVLVLVN